MATPAKKVEVKKKIEPKKLSLDEFTQQKRWTKPIVQTPIVDQWRKSDPPPLKEGESTGAYMSRVFKEHMESELIGRTTSDYEAIGPAVFREALDKAARGVGGYCERVQTEPDFYGRGQNVRGRLKLPVWEDGQTSPDRIKITSSPYIQDKNQFFIASQPSTDSLLDYFTSSSITLPTGSSTYTSTGGRWETFDAGMITGTSAVTAGNISIDFETSSTTLANQIYAEYYKENPEAQKQRTIEKIKQTIKRNLLIKMNSRQRISHEHVTPAELKARQTLRDFITEKDWRRYITNGFLMVQGKSGKWYQIFADRSHTIVFENGKRIRELCIVTDSLCPPSDHVFTIKTMVELDEQSVWDGANKYNPRNNQKGVIYDAQGNLLDLLARAA